MTASLARRPEASGRVALYGSLRRGQPASRQLRLDRMLRWIGTCVVPGRLYDFGDYPGLVPDDDGEVVADLFAVRRAEALSVMDAFEGYRHHEPAASLYLRRSVDLIRPLTSAWIYVYNTGHDAHDHRNAPVIGGGDWLAHRLCRRTNSGAQGGRE